MKSKIQVYSHITQNWHNVWILNSYEVAEKILVQLINDYPDKSYAVDKSSV